MKHLLLAGTALLCLHSSPVFAFDKELGDLNQTTFQSVDANQDGAVSWREVEHFRNLVMLSMDSNDDGVVTSDEYIFWDMGWADLAETRDKFTELEAARRDVFKVWDRNGDGRLSPDEQTLSQTRDFYVASENTNESLNFKQFSTRLRIIAAMNDALTRDEHVTLINAFTVPAGKEAETVKFWDDAAEFMRNQPGYISTALHQAVLPNAEFALINVAKWRSIDSFKTASAALRTESGIKPVEGLTPNASLYKVIRSD